LGHPDRVFWWVASITLLLDQVSKALVRVMWSSVAERHPLDRIIAAYLEPVFRPSESLPLVGQSLRLTYVRNTGAAFGMFPGYQPLFIATSIVVLVVVGAYWRRARPAAWPVVVALGLVTGGAMGNLIDRALLVTVTDFFDVAIIDFPVFNIADSAIFVGVGILVFWLLFGPEEGAGAERSAGEVDVPVAPPGDSTSQDESSR
jgi:signal peptidase II